MTRKILEIAKSLGLTARLSQEKQWQILPQEPEEAWILTRIESFWILSVKNVPQLSLNEPEAIAFLASRSRLENKD